MGYEGMIVSDNHVLYSIIKDKKKDLFPNSHISLATSIPVDADCHYMIVDFPENKLDFARLSFLASKIRIILCMNKDTELLGEALDAGIYDILYKPFRIEQIYMVYKNLGNILKIEKELQASELELSTIMDMSEDLIWVKDVNGDYLNANQSFFEMCGKTIAEVYGRNDTYVWNMGEPVCLESDLAVTRTRKDMVFDETVTGVKGTRRYNVKKSPMFNQNSEMVGIVGMAHDITDMRAQRNQITGLLNDLPFAIMVRAENGLVTQVNDLFLEYFQPAGEIIGERFGYEELLCEKKKENGYAYINIEINGKKEILEVQSVKLVNFFGEKDGEIVIFRNVTQARVQQEKVRSLAVTDDLTGLFNRYGLLEAYEALEAGTSVYFMYFDIDNFKIVNEVYGHNMGDDLLRELGRLLYRLAKEHTVARIGGDQFIVIVQDEEAEAKQLAEEVLDGLYRMNLEEGVLKLVSLSIGIVQNKAGTKSLEDILIQCDKAMYQARKAKRHQYYISTDE